MIPETRTQPRAWDDPALGLRVLVLGGGVPRAFTLPEDGIVLLGRDPASGIVIEDGSVSREHAAIHVRSGSLMIEDAGSRNGTRVAGKQLRRGERTELRVDEVFELGSVHLVVKGRHIGDSKSVSGRPGLTEPPPGSAMARVLDLVALVAPAPVCVLLLGETGVGKTAVAERLHNASGRRGPLMKLNCAAVPEALLEGELFGYERGAFTGAQASKAGLIEAADGGTLLLDEIGDMALPTQAKLLHVVEHGELMRLGALKPRPIDVRFVAATHRDLARMSAAGTFRTDLLYRLNAITITIPSLRERQDETLALAEHFLTLACARLPRDVPILSDAAKSAMRAHDWPGNLRELRNVMDRVALLARDPVISVEALGLPRSERSASTPAPPSPPGVTGDLRTELDALERDRIIAALEKAEGNQARAADIVGLPLRTFVKRLTRYGLTKPRQRSAR